MAFLRSAYIYLCRNGSLRATPANGASERVEERGKYLRFNHCYSTEFVG